MKEIEVVQNDNAREFQENVNSLLKQGYILHGDPQYQYVSCQDTWDGRLRSWTKHSYVQVLKRDTNN